MENQQNRKKILFVITKSNWGGAQKYVFELASMLPSDRFEVTVALGGEGELKTRLIAQKISVESLSSLERNVSLFKDFHAFTDLLILFRKKKWDIVHLNS